MSKTLGLDPLYGSRFHTSDAKHRVSPEKVRAAGQSLSPGRPKTAEGDEGEMAATNRCGCGCGCVGVGVRVRVRVCVCATNALLKWLRLIGAIDCLPPSRKPSRVRPVHKFCKGKKSATK